MMNKQTEKSVQILLWNTLNKKYEMMIPNCYTQFDNEADMFCFRKSGFVDEFEIKLSKADFKNDAKKNVFLFESRTFAPKYESLVSGNMSNYFWYVYPSDLGIDINDVPEWAGVITLSSRGASIIRQAKRLHGVKMSLVDRYSQIKKLGYRFWNQQIAS